MSCCCYESCCPSYGCNSYGYSSGHRDYNSGYGSGSNSYEDNDYSSGYGSGSNNYNSGYGSGSDESYDDEYSSSDSYGYGGSDHFFVSNDKYTEQGAYDFCKSRNARLANIKSNNIKEANKVLNSHYVKDAWINSWNTDRYDYPSHTALILTAGKGYSNGAITEAEPTSLHNALCEKY